MGKLLLFLHSCVWVDLITKSTYFLFFYRTFSCIFTGRSAQISCIYCTGKYKRTFLQYFLSLIHKITTYVCVVCVSFPWKKGILPGLVDFTVCVCM